ncbi:hypothetical protein LBMAG42_07700 [Deltaproteobacteria bacterium]|nr:hypothetical protein LBMAG42_07700 [Deltaproteobacteria bacterium]
MLSLLVTIALARGAVPTLALPPGECVSDWEEALDAAGLEVGVGGVYVETGAVWRLRYAAAGGERTASVPAPKTESGREQVAIVAASLMRGGRVSGSITSPPPAARAQPTRTALPRRVASVPVLPPVPAAPLVAPAVAPEPAPLAATPEPATVEPPASPPPDRTELPVVATEPPPSPVATTLARVPIANPRLRFDVGVGAVGGIRPGLGLLPGDALSVRVSRGPVWLEAAGATYSPTVFELGSLGLATLSARAGASAEPFDGWTFRGGAGVVAQRWSVADLDGTHVAPGVGLELLLGVDRRLWRAVSAEVTAVGAWDAQGIQIDALPSAPSRLSGGLVVGLRVGR